MHWQSSLVACMLLWVAATHLPGDFINPSPVAVAAPNSAREVDADSPTQIVHHLIQAISSIKSVDQQPLSDADASRNLAATRKAHAILDIPSVSKRVLGRHWKDRSPAERDEFVALMTELFAKVAYPKSASFFGDFEVQVLDERIHGKRAEVKTTVSDPKEGLISVDYRLRNRDGHWRVRDIVLDDVSLARNLRSQCSKIIKQHSYAELLRRMRKKLNEAS